MATQKLNLTRDQLATFLKNHEQIKQFEALFQIVDQVSPSSDTPGIELQAGNAEASANEALAQLIVLARDAAVNNGAAENKAQQALDSLAAIANLVQILATQPVAQNNNSLSTDYVDVSTVAPTAVGGIAGRLKWNDTEGTLDLGLKGGNVTLQIGQENVLMVKNDDSVALTDGMVVYISGANGANLLVKRALANSDLTSASTIGVVTETLAINGQGFITTFGTVRGLNTNAFNEGDILYLSPTTAGALTNVKPVAPQHFVTVGYVEKKSGGNGEVFVKVDNGYELDELHNVLITNPVLAGSLLIYNATTGVWQNARLTAGANVSITNADGSITIASSNPGGTVTSVGLSAPTGFAVGGSPVTGAGTLALSFSAGYSLPTTASQSNWDTAYSERRQWDGGSTNLVAATGRTSLGATTVGSSLFTLGNPSAVTYLRVNADNSVSALDAATFRTAIGAGTGNGTVTAVTASAPLASSGGTAPNITISGSALTKTDDTNVTVTLGGSPSAALLAAVSMTIGWTGQLSVSRGGTGLSSLTAGYIPYGNGTGAFGNSSNLYFSGTNLGLGTTSPDVFGRGYGRIFGINSASNAAIEMNSAAGNGVYFDMGVAGVRALNLYADSTSAAIATAGAKVLSIGTNSAPAIVIDTSQNVFPNTDNAKTLGAAGNRWSVVYAGTGTINTSDARQKTPVCQMTGAEISAATQLAREIGTFKFLSSVAEKGDRARTHVGMTVQRAIEIMLFNGLDPMAYGFICHDQWDRQEVKIAARLAEDGSVLDEEKVFVTEAGERYGFRTDELLMFVARGFEERLTKIEKEMK